MVDISSNIQIIEKINTIPSPVDFTDFDNSLHVLYRYLSADYDYIVRMVAKCKAIQLIRLSHLEREKIIDTLINLLITDNDSVRQRHVFDVIFPFLTTVEQENRLVDYAYKNADLRDRIMAVLRPYYYNK